MTPEQSLTDIAHAAQERARAAELSDAEQLLQARTAILLDWKPIVDRTDTPPDVLREYAEIVGCVASGAQSANVGPFRAWDSWMAGSADHWPGSSPLTRWLSDHSAIAANNRAALQAREEERERKRKEKVATDRKQILDAGMVPSPRPLWAERAVVLASEPAGTPLDIRKLLIWLVPVDQEEDNPGFAFWTPYDDYDFTDRVTDLLADVDSAPLRGRIIDVQEKLAKKKKEAEQEQARLEEARADQIYRLGCALYDGSLWEEKNPLSLKGWQDRAICAEAVFNTVQQYLIKTCLRTEQLNKYWYLPGHPSTARDVTQVDCAAYGASNYFMDALAMASGWLARTLSAAATVVAPTVFTRWDCTGPAVQPGNTAGQETFYTATFTVTVGQLTFTLKDVVLKQ
jgi:hypothetical protein